MSNALRAHGGGLLRIGAAVAVAAALMALPVGGGAAYGFQAQGMGYTCMDNLEVSPNAPPAMAWDDAGLGTPTNIAGDDNGANFPLPFAFTYNGLPQTFVNICTNGWMNFGANLNQGWPYTNGIIPQAGWPNGTIYAYWDDMISNGGNMITYMTVGTAPNRRYVVTWTNLPSLSGAGIAQVTMQIALYETSNAIRVQYQAVSGTQGTGGSASMGIEDINGTQGIQYLNNGQPFTNLISAGRVVGYWTTGSTPPWVPAPTPPPAPGGGAGGPAAITDVDDDEKSRTHQFCGGAAGGSVAFVGLALALGLAASVVRRSA